MARTDKGQPDGHHRTTPTSFRQIPMDYDDTDFQSQNFQLAGEDNSKYPSGLWPFALPKLDIDGQIQGHLRFDNITDSEGFFSIGGHDNSWIEVLSTGSSVVDFSSSAAKSCSISRANYVWSEATFTECVEMLLKSVGENEMTGNMDGNTQWMRKLNRVQVQLYQRTVVCIASPKSEKSMNCREHY